MRLLTGLFLGLTCALLTPALVGADELYGTCRGAGGEKCQTHHRITTSWNGNSARIDPSAGAYELDLGGSVEATVTVYCDGSKVGTVRVSGRTRFDVRCD